MTIHGVEITDETKMAISEAILQVQLKIHRPLIAEEIDLVIIAMVKHLAAGGSTLDTLH